MVVVLPVHTLSQMSYNSDIFQYSIPGYLYHVKIYSKLYSDYVFVYKSGFFNSQ